MSQRILILSASAGAGHLRAAQALEKAFTTVAPDAEVRNVDTLEYTNALFRRLYSRTYLDLVNKAPEVLGWLYDYLDEPWKNQRRRLAFDRLNTGPFKKMLAEFAPDAIVSTHFLPAEIVSYLKSEDRLRCRQSVVVTDFDVHAMWLCHSCEHYFVALEETRLHLAALGVPIGNISTTGIPIDPAFAAPVDRTAVRIRLGLQPDKPVVLISAGGFGVGPIDHLIEAMEKIEHPLQIVMICGRNEELRERMSTRAAQRRAASASGPSFSIVGYTTEMDAYMSAADLLVGKPGGLTTSEALAKGLVMVIVNPIPGQEERNSDHLLEQGVAIRCNNLPIIGFKIDQLLADPARFNAMRERSLAMGRPDAAMVIAKKVLASARTDSA